MPATHPLRVLIQPYARLDGIEVASGDQHAFFPSRICANQCLFFLARTPFATLGSGESHQTLFRTVPSPLRARFPPNASDMQAPGLPPRPGAVVLAGSASWRATRGGEAAMLRLASWNINSIRQRVDNVRQLVAEWAPDVLCLQETKTPDERFPCEIFEALGYRHMLVHGMKGYNGVAVLSRAPFASV